jgi:hypothetical protein
MRGVLTSSLTRGFRHGLNDDQTRHSKALETRSKRIAWSA